MLVPYFSIYLFHQRGTCTCVSSSNINIGMSISVNMGTFTFLNNVVILMVSRSSACLLQLTLLHAFSSQWYSTTMEKDAIGGRQHCLAFSDANTGSAWTLRLVTRGNILWAMLALSLWEWVTNFYLDNLDRSWPCVFRLVARWRSHIAQRVTPCIISITFPAAPDRQAVAESFSVWFWKNLKTSENV